MNRWSRWCKLVCEPIFHIGKEGEPMTVELLKKVAAKLRRMRHKKHFDMRDWIQENECGTAACIAGHALLDAGYRLRIRDYEIVSPKGRKVDPSSAAQRLLGLSSEQAARLFVAINWPKEFRGKDDGEACYDPDIYNDPKVAAARIDHFIKTKGRE
jgi:hypothetical protein